MKIAAIGDVHGREIWKEIAEDASKNADKIVFLGDYIDPYPEVIKKRNESKIIKTYEDFRYKNWYEDDEFSDEEKEYMKNVPLESEIEPLSELDDDWEDGDENLSDEEFYDKYYSKYSKFFTQYKHKTYEETVGVLLDLIDFKKKNPDKVILLIGNHDAHYLFDEISACSRYDFKNAKKYGKIYRENKDLFQYAYQEGNHLFTHAGVCTTWYDFFDATLESYGIKKDNSNLADVINKMGTDKLGNKTINVVSHIRGGRSLAGGPTWADYLETKYDYLEGIHQYVGHSKVNYIHTNEFKFRKGSITYCDVLETPKPNMASNYKLITI